MLRRWDIYQRAHVEHEIRRRRWHIGPAEARRRKAQPARNRLRRQLARAA
jgi:ribosomal protein S21